MGEDQIERGQIVCRHCGYRGKHKVALYAARAQRLICGSCSRRLKTYIRPTDFLLGLIPVFIALWWVFFG